MMDMRFKEILLSIILLFFLPVICQKSYATVGGDCDVCHNLYPGMMEKTYSKKAFQYVLKNEFCVNCHSNITSDTIKILGGNRVPVVYNSVPPINSLAGGNFYYVGKDFGDRKGHNVYKIASSDMKFRNEPPGYSRRNDHSSIGYNFRENLMCAGSNGCHGDRNIEDPFLAIIGTHHAIDKPIDGSTTAKSYRFLKNTSNEKGVIGLEDKDWNQKANSNKHNEYSKSIDVVCISCHGSFHDIENKQGGWFRHPVGVALPFKKGYEDYKVYNIDAPIAREILSNTSSSEINTGKDSVMCLSCHLAHAGPYDSALRWDYENLYASENGKSGCLICHMGK